MSLRQRSPAAPPARRSPPPPAPRPPPRSAAPASRQRRTGGEHVVHQHARRVPPTPRASNAPATFACRASGRERGLGPGLAPPAPGRSVRTGRAGRAAQRRGDPLALIVAPLAEPPGAERHRYQGYLPGQWLQPAHRLRQRLGDPPPALVLESMDGVARAAPEPDGAPDPRRARRASRRRAGTRDRRRPAGRSASQQRRGHRLPAAPAELADQRVALPRGHRRLAQQAGRRQQPALRRRAQRPQRSAASTAARMTSTGGCDAGKPALERRRALRHQHAPAVGRAEARPRAWRGSTASRRGRTPCRARPGAPGGGAASGSGSSRCRPSGVVLITTRASVGRPTMRTPSAARPVLEAAGGGRPTGTTTATGTPRSRAAPTAARAPPPVPITSQGPGGGSRSSSAASRPGHVGVVPDACRRPRPRRCCRRPVARPSPAGDRPPRAATSLCGTVTLPPPPARLSARDQAGHVLRSGSGGRRTPPGVRGPGRRRCAWPERANARPDRRGWRRRAWCRRSPHRAGDAADHGADQLLQLGVGAAVAGEVGAERIADLGAARPRARRRRRAGAPCPRRPSSATRARWWPGHDEHEIGASHQLPRQQPGAVLAEVETVLQPDEVGAFGHRRAVPGARCRRRRPSPGRARAPPAPRAGAPSAIGLRQVLPVQTKRDVRCSWPETSVTARAARRRAAARRAGSRPRAPSGAPESVQSTSVDGGTLPSTPPSSTSSSPLLDRGLEQLDQPVRPRRGRAAGPIGGGRGQRLPGDAPPGVRCPGARCAAPRCRLPGRAARPGRRPSPPRSTSVSGPGQNASDSARADAVNTSPQASAMTRPETSSRNGLPGARPLSLRQRRERRHRAGSSPARRPSRWDSRAGRPAARCAATDGMAALDLGWRAERQDHAASPREQLGERQVLGRGDLHVARTSRAPAAPAPRCARPARRRPWRRARHRPRRRPARAPRAESPAASAPARARRAGPCARMRRGSVEPSASLSVSLTRTAATAPSPARACAMTASMTGRSTNGRARIVHQDHPCSPAPSAARPAATESPRSAPPATTTRRRPHDVRGGTPADAAGIGGGQDERHLGHVGMGRERSQRAQHHRHAARSAGTAWAGLAAETRAPARGHDDDADVTRQAPAPAARRGRARPSRRPPPACRFATSRTRGGSRAARLRRSAARSRRWDGSRRRGRSRRGR